MILIPSGSYYRGILKVVFQQGQLSMRGLSRNAQS